MNKNKIISLIAVFALLFTIVPFNALTVYGDNVDDFYDTFLSKFSEVLDSTNDIGTLTIMLTALKDDDYSDEIENALDSLSDEAFDILVANGFLEDEGNDIYDYSALADVLYAFNDVIEGPTNSNDYTGSKIIDILQMVKEDGSTLSQTTRNEILAAYTYIYSSLPTAVQNDFNRYGNSTNEKAGVLLELVQYVYMNGDTLVRTINDNIEISLYDDYIDAANDVLKESVMDGEEPIVLNDHHEEAINVILDIIGQKLSAQNSNIRDEFKNLFKKLELYSFELKGIDVDLKTIKSNDNDFVLTVTGDYFDVADYLTIDSSNIGMTLSTKNGDIISAIGGEENFENGFYMTGQFTQALPAGEYLIFLILGDDIVLLADYDEELILSSTSPSTGGSPSGGDTSSTPSETEPEITTPEDKEEPVKAELPEGAVETSKNDEGQTEAEVDGDAIHDAVAGILDALEEGGDDTGAREAVVSVEVESDTEDLAVNIPADAVENLIENNVGLNIKSDKLEYDVPAGAIDEEALEEFGKDVTVQFSSKIVDTEEAYKDIEIDSTFETKGKVLELSLDVLDKKGDKVGSISKFKKPLIIKISLDDVTGDNDKLGVYYLNPETGKPEFVGGKIDNGMVVLKIYHYSKYAILEAKITYSDLTDHWSKSYVESMAAKHVVNGYPDGTYLPQKNVTRAEFTKLIVKALELDMVKFRGEYSDINADDWSADYVATAAVNGIVSGYTDGTFLPNKEISRLEMATMLGNAISNVELNENAVNTINIAFADSSSIAQWGQENAAKVYQEGLMVGMDGKFEPQETTTRAQAATAIYRLFNK